MRHSQGMPLPVHECTRYITALREGGSVPALVEGSDDGTYVMKLSGAAQGAKALVADLVGTELARAVGLPALDLVLLNLTHALARMEGDPEIQGLLRKSVGLNLGVDWLPGSHAYDPAARRPVDDDLRTRVLWLDAWLGNVDRTARNTNMLWWHGRLWLIDHGAALTFHHDWQRLRHAPVPPFGRLRDHVWWTRVGALRAVHEAMAERIDEALLHRVLALVPDAWLPAEQGLTTPAEHRQAYVDVLMARLAHMSVVVPELA